MDIEVSVNYARNQAQHDRSHSPEHLLDGSDRNSHNPLFQMTNPHNLQSILLVALWIRNTRAAIQEGRSRGG